MVIFLLSITGYPKNHIYGIYRLSSSATGVILILKDNSNLEYLNWVDLGGWWNGFNGEYSIKNDNLTILIFYPVNDDTHYVRLDTLLIRDIDGTKFLVPTFKIEEFDESILNDIKPTYWYEVGKTDSIPWAGIDCFVKLSSSKLKDVTDRKIIWSKVKNLNGVRIKLPPPPPRPKLDTLIDESEIELK